ncbi:MAG: tetratricopeptide repeat protein [Spirochaetales bacterium]|nr:tetratricopeptide repeat protein [Spirochaetales bacterium]
MKEKSSKEKMMDKVANFFQNNRTVIWIILGVIVVVMIGFIVMNQITMSTNSAALDKLNDVRENYNNWYTESDKEKKQSIESDILEQLTAIISDYSNTYAALKSLQMRADIYYANKEYETAAKDYLKIYTSFPKSDLASVAMYNQAICYEELKEYAKANDLFAKVMEKYPESAEAPKSAYAVCRILVKQEENSLADEYFTKIEDKYASSDWQKIAQNLRIELKAKGLIQ